MRVERIPVTKRLCAGLVLLTGGLLLHACKKPPPSIPSGCWTHEAASSDDLSCASETEGEPNGDLPIAAPMSTAGCASKSFEGRVSDDIDVFHAAGEPCKDGSPPHATLMTDQDDVRLCLFVTCRHGKTTLSACAGSPSPADQAPVPSHMPEGMQGCCRAGQGTLTTSVHCDSEYSLLGADPSFETFMVVDRVRDTACTKYSVEYGF